MNNQPVTITLGQSGDSFVVANGRDRVTVKREPAGLNFYDIKWPRNQLGTIQVSHGFHSFKVEGILGCTGAEDKELREEGISIFDFSVAIATPEAIPHLKARDRIFWLLQMLQAVGWRRQIMPIDPRLNGREALEFSIKEFGVYSLDPNYIPSLKEWMQLGSHAMWNLYADGIYMKLEFNRDAERMNPVEPGAYLLSFEIKSEAEYLKMAFAPEDRNRWLELWPARKKELERERAEAEAKARAQGLAIDTTYTDPPVLALQRGGRK